jgi:O-antigen/teichoic acid export membrane protein
MLGFNLLKALAQNTDRLVIGSLLGAHALGVYTFAYRAVISPVGTFVGALGSYLFPRVARLQGDRPRLRAVHRAVLMAILHVVLPGLAVLVVLAPAVVPLFGTRWAESVPLIQVLALAAVAQAIIAPVGQLMKGLGRSGWLIMWSIGFTLITALAVWIGAGWGLVGTSLGYVIAHGIGLPVILIIGWRLTGLRVRDLLEVGWRSALAATALGVCLKAISPYALSWSPQALAAGALVMGTIYLVALARLHPEFAALATQELRKLRVSGEKTATMAGMPPRG